MDFSERLKILRENKEMSQRDLANKLNVSSSAISMYERGERTPDLDIIKKLCIIFNVDSDYLIGRKDVNSKLLKEDIGSAFDDILELLDDEDSIAFYGDITKLNQEQREILKSAIKHAIDMTNTMVNKENND